MNINSIPQGFVKAFEYKVNDEIDFYLNVYTGRMEQCRAESTIPNGCIKITALIRSTKE